MNLLGKEFSGIREDVREDVHEAADAVVAAADALVITLMCITAVAVVGVLLGACALRRSGGAPGGQPF